MGNQIYFKIAKFQRRFLKKFTDGRQVMALAHIGELNKINGIKTNVCSLNNKKKQIHAYIQTDRRIDIDLGNVKMHRKRDI